MTIPCLWLTGIGSMFRVAADSVAAASAEEQKQGQQAPQAPSAVAGPQPTFVPAPNPPEGHIGQQAYPGQ